MGWQTLPSYTREIRVQRSNETNRRSRRPLSTRVKRGVNSVSAASKCEHAWLYQPTANSTYDFGLRPLFRLATPRKDLLMSIRQPQKATLFRVPAAATSANCSPTLRPDDLKCRAPGDFECLLESRVHSLHGDTPAFFTLASPFRGS